jgi:hypothetical protein
VPIIPPPLKANAQGSQHPYYTMHAIVATSIKMVKHPAFQVLACPPLKGVVILPPFPRERAVVRAMGKTATG